MDSPALLAELNKGLKDTGARVHVDAKGKASLDITDFTGRHNEGDIKAANIVLKSMEEIRGDKNTLGGVRDVMLAVGNAKRDKNLLGSDLKDVVLGKALTTLRKHLNGISPELKALNQRYADDMEQLTEIQNLFSIRNAQQTSETTANKMMSVFSSKPFARKRLELLKEIEEISNTTIIPEVLGIVGQDALPAGLKSQLLSSGQFVAAGVPAALLGGIPAVVATAIVTVPMMSPKFVIKYLKRKGLIKNAVEESQVMQAITRLNGMIPKEMMTQGLTYGSALERLQGRSNDVLTSIGQIRRQ